MRDSPWGKEKRLSKWVWENMWCKKMKVSQNLQYVYYSGVSVKECDSLMVIPTLKSNAGDQRICKKKNLSWLFGADRNIRPSGSLFGITRQSLVMPYSDPRTDFLSAPHTHERLMVPVKWSLKFNSHLKKVLVQIKLAKCK